MEAKLCHKRINFKVLIKNDISLVFWTCLIFNFVSKTNSVIDFRSISSSTELMDKNNDSKDIHYDIIHKLRTDVTKY